MKFSYVLDWISLARIIFALSFLVKKRTHMNNCRFPKKREREKKKACTSANIYQISSWCIIIHDNPFMQSFEIRATTDDVIFVCLFVFLFVFKEYLEGFQSIVPNLRQAKGKGNISAQVSQKTKTKKTKQQQQQKKRKIQGI